MDEFINATSTTTPLEMYTADMFVVPFNLRIEPDDPIEFDVIVDFNSYVGITDTDYWTDEGILLIHFSTFIVVATVNASKLSLSRNYYQDANNTVIIKSGEIWNQSPSLARYVGIKLTLSDLALLASKGICTGSNKSFIQDCYLGVQSGFAAAYHGASVSPSTGHQVNNFQSALTGELNVLAFIAVVSAHLTISHYTVRVENFVQFQILPYLENFACVNSTFHVYNFRVISHPRKTRN